MSLFSTVFQSLKLRCFESILPTCWQAVDAIVKMHDLNPVCWSIKSKLNGDVRV